MWRLSAIAVAVLGLTAAAADALEFKNVRSIYGPFGSVRSSSKYLQSDFILLFYDLEGLKIDDESGNVRYDVILEVFGKKKETPINQPFALGGKKATSSIHIVLGDQKPGKYAAKITVQDKGSKQSASFTYNFEIVPTELGFIHVSLPAYGFINNDYAGQVVVVGMARDSKKLQNVDVNVRIFDEQNKPTITKPISTNIPKNLPEELAGKDYGVVPITFLLTRVGEFRVEIEAIDHVAKKTIKLRFPVKVVDPSAVK